MNYLDAFVNIYKGLYFKSMIPFWILTPPRRAVRYISNKVLPIYLSRPHRVRNRTEPKLIVSFTSFPSRIENVWQVVECMERQSLRPYKIILWLSRNQFPNENCIPESLKSKQNNLFEIRFVEGDIRSHKKYYYVSKEYPDYYVFLIDDDIYYSSKILEKTWETHLEHPNAIICNYGQKIKYEEDGSRKCYNQWKPCYDYSIGNSIFFGSGGGTLFRPSDMHGDFLNLELALKFTPTADDVWLNVMARFSKLEIVLQKNGLILPIINRNDIKLSSGNVDKFENDQQIIAVENYYQHDKSVLL